MTTVGKKRPVVSEKSARLLEQGQYVFYVPTNLNKIEVRKQIEKEFNVNVTSVNLLNVKGKERVRGRFRGATQDRKKVIVSLKAGQEISEIKALF